MYEIDKLKQLRSCLAIVRRVETLVLHLDNDYSFSNIVHLGLEPRLLHCTAGRVDFLRFKFLVKNWFVIYYY